VDPVDSYFVPTQSALNFSVEISGQDPIYRFPRTCDRSDIDHLDIVTSSPADSVVFARGRCFNATVTLVFGANVLRGGRNEQNQSHVTSGDENFQSVALLAGNESKFWSMISMDKKQAPFWLVLILLVVNLALVAAISALCITARKRRKNTGETSSPEFVMRVSKADSQETNYEAPWEMKAGKKYKYYAPNDENFEKNERGVIVIKT